MMDQITLSWPGKEMLLASVGDARYEWIDPQDYSPRALDDLLVEHTPGPMTLRVVEVDPHARVRAKVSLRRDQSVLEH